MGTFDTITAGDGSARVYLAGTGSAGTQGSWSCTRGGASTTTSSRYADRLAAAGFTVAAPDLFDGQIATTVEGAEGLAHGADEEAVNAIVLAALDRLTEGLDASATIAALGFSFGAHWAIWSPTQRDRVVATVLYYGTTGDNLDASTAPVQGHFAEDDPFESAEWVAEFESILRSAGRDVEFHRYPNTGHWFAEPSRDAYRARSGRPRLRANRRVPAGPAWRGRAGRLSPAGPARASVNRRRGSPGTRPGALRRRLEARASIRRSCTWSRPPSRRKELSLLLVDPGRRRARHLRRRERPDLDRRRVARVRPVVVVAAARPGDRAGLGEDRCQRGPDDDARDGTLAVVDAGRDPAGLGQAGGFGRGERHADLPVGGLELERASVDGVRGDPSHGRHERGLDDGLGRSAGLLASPRAARSSSLSPATV